MSESILVALLVQLYCLLVFTKVHEVCGNVVHNHDYVFMNSTENFILVVPFRIFSNLIESLQR